MRKVESILDLIGKTPVVRLNKLPAAGSADIWLKLEYFNPGSSIKDRIGVGMLEAAEKAGKIAPGATIVEPTSGNTGVGLAIAAAAKGYHLILVMPETMSAERKALFQVFGAEFVLSPGADGMNGAVQTATEIVKKNPGYFMPQQFENPDNPATHEKTTALEILEQFESIDAFVAGIGTGGTITGVGKVLKKERPGALVVGVEPDSSPVISGGNAGPHKIQGIGAGFIPKTLDVKLLDRIIRVKNDDAITTAQKLASREGILTGISGGAAAFAAMEIAKELGAGKTVVAIAPDTGERYISTDMYKFD